MSSKLPKVVGGCFGCLGFLIAFAIVLVALFYIEEDWRGAHELSEAKARWQAEGYSLDAADCIPPPVPDDKNLAALPVYQLEPDPEMKGKRMDVLLHAAVDEDKHGGSLTDPDKKADLTTLVARAYAKKFPGKTPPTSAVAQLEALYPLIVDLRTAAPTHPEFRLNLDYLSQPPYDRPLGPVTRQIAVARLLKEHAQLALQENDTEVALQDIQINFQIARGVAKDPSLVGGLVSVGVTAITRLAMDDGLEKHTWNDAQLVQLQDTLKQSDFLASYQFVMRGDVAAFTLPLYAWLKDEPSRMRLVYGMADNSQDGQGFWPHAVEDISGFLWANGWWDMNAAQTANAMLEAVHCIDLKARLVNPALKQQLDDKMQRAKESPTKIAPWNLLYLVAEGPMTNAVEKFAQGQVQLDEDRIVCGLERYRLAQGAYPPKLDALTPAYIDEMPHDIMNGEPFHYRLNADGTFLLYSVGWDQVDEGGTVGYQADNPNKINYEFGDWVWPMVKK